MNKFILKRALPLLSISLIFCLWLPLKGHHSHSLPINLTLYIYVSLFILDEFFVGLNFLFWIRILLIKLRKFETLIFAHRYSRLIGFTMNCLVTLYLVSLSFFFIIRHLDLFFVFLLQNLNFMRLIDFLYDIFVWWLSLIFNLLRFCVLPLISLRFICFCFVYIFFFYTFCWHISYNYLFITLLYKLLREINWKALQIYLYHFQLYIIYNQNVLETKIICIIPFINQLK